MDWLVERRPELVERYEGLYRSGAYAPASERKRLAGLVQGRAPGNGFRRGSSPPLRATDASSESRESQQSLF
jgi:hypothetical protein